MSMKQFLTGLFLSGALTLSAFAAPLSSNARTVVPSVVQQMISVDYRALRDSPAARALRDRVLPDNLKEFETALKASGIDPDKDVEQLTLVIYRSPKGPRSIGIAQGPFKKAEFLQKMKAKKVRPEKYALAYLYPMGSGMQLVFLDPSTILFGDNPAIKGAIDVRDSGAESLESNNIVNGLIGDVENSPLWSVLDQAGTQNMLRSALGQASSVGDYDVVKKRLGVGLHDGLRQWRDLRPEREDFGHDERGHYGNAVESGSPVSQDECYARGKGGAGEYHRGQLARHAADALQGGRSAFSGAAEVGAVCRSVQVKDRRDRDWEPSVARLVAFDLAWVGSVGRDRQRL